MSVKRVLGRWGWHAALALLLIGAGVLAGVWLRIPIGLALGLLLAHAVRRRWRDVGLAAALVAGLVAVAVFVTLRIDLGPAARVYAEAAGSSFLKRPLHIEQIAIHLGGGRFVLRGVRIDGLRPGDGPFLTARQITVAVPWWSVVVSRHVLIDAIEMTGWRVKVEQFQDGRHNVPNLTPAPSKGPRRFRTTVRAIHALGGEFAYVQHGTWSTIAPGLDVEVLNIEGKYRGAFAFTGGRIQIQQYLPMRSDGRAEFRFAKSHILLDKILWFADGMRTEGTGDVDVSRWPEQTYHLVSDVDLATAKQVFFTHETWRARGQARWTGTFHLFKGGRGLRGRFKTPLGYVNDYAFPNAEGQLVWTPTLFAVWDAKSDFYDGKTRYAYKLEPLGSSAPTQVRFDTTYEGVDLDAFMSASGVPMLRLLGRATGYNRLDCPMGRWAQRTGSGSIRAVPPPGVDLLGRNPLPEEEAAAPIEPTAGPVVDPRLHQRSSRSAAPSPIAFDPAWVTFDECPRDAEHLSSSSRAGPATASVGRYPFYARSADWQESDRVMAAIFTVFGSPTGVVTVGGWGDFRGVMLGRVPRPARRGGVHRRGDARLGRRVGAGSATW